MVFGLCKRANLYRELAAGLSNPQDIASAFELAAQLEDISRLEVPDCAFEVDQRCEAAWLRQALPRLFSVPQCNPVYLEILFAEVLSGQSDQ